MTEPVASRFPAALRAAMKRQGMTQTALSRMTGVSPSRISAATLGLTMPLMESIGALALALDAPELATIAVEEATRACDECGTVFMRGMRHRRDGRFCKARCRQRWHSRHLAAGRKTGREDRIRSLSRQVSVLREQMAEDRDELAATQADIDAFCWECEPEGLCRTASCRMRERSPLPLASARVRVA